MTRPLTPKQQKLAGVLQPVTGAGITIEPAIVETGATTIAWRGATGVQFHRLASYTPVAADNVLVLKQGSQLVILGKII